MLRRLPQRWIILKIPGLIEHRRLREEALSHGSVVRVKLLTSDELLHRSKQMEIDGCYCPGCMVNALKLLNHISAFFHELDEKDADEHCHAALKCVDLSHCACREWHVAV